jgi:hypothetical protein
MKIVIAADGHLDPEATSDLVGRIQTDPPGLNPCHARS